MSDSNARKAQSTFSVLYSKLSKMEDRPESGLSLGSGVLGKISEWRDCSSRTSIQGLPYLPRYLYSNTAGLKRQLFKIHIRLQKSHRNNNLSTLLGVF